MPANDPFAETRVPPEIGAGGRVQPPASANAPKRYNSAAWSAYYKQQEKYDWFRNQIPSVQAAMFLTGNAPTVPVRPKDEL